MTSCPHHSRYRRRTSNTSENRPWPTCGGPYTVGPHTYIDTLPGSRNSTGRTSPAAVSNRRNMSAQGTGRLHRHRQGFEAAQHEVLAVLDLVGSDGEGQRRVATHEPIEHDLAFEPGQCGTEAVVDAMAEREVLVVGAADVEAVRLRELLRVAVRRRQQGDHLRSLGKHLTGDLEVGRGDAAGEVDGAVESQRLLHR